MLNAGVNVKVKDYSRSSHRDPEGEQRQSSNLSLTPVPRCRWVDNTVKPA